jgi:EAL domain-containing protein (putative c-di-GMP-specific phosphodiesterase class I)
MLTPHPDRKRLVPFGHRRIAPHVCIADRKPHIRMFLRDALEDIGFIAHQCANGGELREDIARLTPELVVLGTLNSDADLKASLAALALDRYSGRMMLFGGRASAALLKLHEFGEGLGLAMLPPLLTPFRDSDLRDNLGEFLPVRAPPQIEIEADEALHNGWLEIWYRPKIDLRGIAVIGAHAEVQVRHPNWGVLTPSSFLISETDPKLSKLSGAIIQQAMADWSRFLAARQAFELTLSVPPQSLEEPDVLNRICVHMPDERLFAQLTLEVRSVELARDPGQLRATMKKLTSFNIGVAIDDVTAGSPWIDLGDFPVAELQVDADFVADCAHNRDKAEVCAKVITLAKTIGARTNAKGIHTPAVLKAVHQIGFELGEGDLFGKAMDAQRFARTVVRGRSKQ